MHKLLNNAHTILPKPTNAMSSAHTDPTIPRSINHVTLIIIMNKVENVMTNHNPTVNRTVMCVH